MIKDVTDLRIYQQALENLRLLRAVCALVPDRDWRYQAMGAGKGIAPVTHEGFAKKRSVKEFKRFLEMALGSSDEVVTHLRQALIIFPGLDPAPFNDCIEQYKSLSRQINKTIQNWF